jgi:hypothetical protein
MLRLGQRAGARLTPRPDALAAAARRGSDKPGGLLPWWNKYSKTWMGPFVMEVGACAGWWGAVFVCLSGCGVGGWVGGWGGGLWL